MPAFDPALRTVNHGFSDAGEVVTQVTLGTDGQGHGQEKPPPRKPKRAAPSGSEKPHGTTRSHHGPGWTRTTDLTLIGTVA